MSRSKGGARLSVYHTVLFSMLGALMFISKLLMEFIPNVHPLGMFVMAFTVAYRSKALYPIYIYVLLNGVYCGFAMWWIPYLYIWTVLWAVTMLLPKKMPAYIAAPVYMAVCALHGLLFGTLYAPAQALMFGLDFNQTVAWIAAGLPYDLLQAAGNLAAGTLILPLGRLLITLEKRYAR